MPKPTLDEIFQSSGDTTTKPSLDEIFEVPPKRKNVGVLDKIDSYTGAPTRSLIGSLQKRKGIIDSAKEFGSQFGEDPELAPTATDIRKGFGIPDAPLKDVLSKGSNPFFKIGGLLMDKDNAAAKIDVGDLLIGGATDYSNLIPLGKGLGAIAELVGKGAKALDLGEKAAKVGSLLEKAADSETFRKTALGLIGAKTYGVEGLLGSQLLEPLVKQTIQSAKSSGKGLIKALQKGGKNAVELQDDLFYTIKKNPKIPVKESISGLLREEMARARANKEK